MLDWKRPNSYGHNLHLTHTGIDLLNSMSSKSQASAAGQALWAKMPKANAELFALTYGSLVTELGMLMSLCCTKVFVTETLLSLIPNAIQSHTLHPLFYNNIIQYVIMKIQLK